MGFKNNIDTAPAVSFRDVGRQRERVTSHITFEGFSKDQERWIRKLLEVSGLPLGRIKSFVASQENNYGSPFAYYDIVEQKIVLLMNVHQEWAIDAKAMKMSLASSIIHEVAHASGPTFSALVQGVIPPSLHLDDIKPKGWENLYSPETAQRLHELSIGKAKESIKTGIYLNYYHRNLVKTVIRLEPDFDSKGIEGWHFLHLVFELEAIVVQMRYENPKHLQQVDEATQRKISKNEQESYTSYFDWADDIIGSATGKTNREVDEQVQKTKKFIVA